MVIVNHTYVDDCDLVFSFGKYRGQRLVSAPPEYREWLLRYRPDEPETAALRRMLNRVGVTSLRPPPALIRRIPELTLTQRVLPRIERPDGVCPRLYGTFLELSVKYALGIREFPEVREYLEMRRLLPVRNGARPGRALQIDKRASYAVKSYAAVRCGHGTPADLCNLASAVDHDSDIAASAELYKVISKNSDYYERYCAELAANLPPLLQTDQTHCRNISIGSIVGYIDCIFDNSIVDIKCKHCDPIGDYKVQLFTYYCMWTLRRNSHLQSTQHEIPTILRCEIWNFLLGTSYVMDCSATTTDECAAYLRDVFPSKDHRALFADT